MYRVLLCAEGFTAITADGKILKKVLRHGFESSGKASISAYGRAGQVIDFCESEIR
jgi:hypothetical protein